MNTRKTLWVIAGVGLVCANLVFLFREPAATAQTRVIETVTARRYEMVMTGHASSFIVLDTATGRCWLTSPDKQEWQDIGAPLARGGVPPVRLAPSPLPAPPPPR